MNRSSSILAAAPLNPMVFKLRHFPEIDLSQTKAIGVHWNMTRKKYKVPCSSRNAIPILLKRAVRVRGNTLMYSNKSDILAETWIKT